MIRLSKPDIRPEDIARAVAVLDSGMLVQGPQVEAFERGLAAFAGLPHAVAVSSGTAALHLAFKALGIGPGDTVIVPAFTFPATANAVEVLGAKTALCEVDERTYVATPEALADTIASLRDRRLKAVVVVHEFGFPARIAEIASLCRRHRLGLVEDAACALGTLADGRHPGFHGDAACFSFHPRKAITTGEGGAVLTRRADIAEKVKALRNHGIVNGPAGIDFHDAGWNYRLTDFQAALALGQLERFPEELARRRELAATYRSSLERVPGVSLPRMVPGHSLQSFMVVLDEALSRDRIMSALRDGGVQTNLGAQALNCLAYYRQRYGWNADTCPVATRLYRSGLVLPLYGSLPAGEVRRIGELLQRLLPAAGQGGVP
jgi:dTDP-4-amino-4,6-dideoxygalactose transaminase